MQVDLLGAAVHAVEGARDAAHRLHAAAPRAIRDTARHADHLRPRRPHDLAGVVRRGGPADLRARLADAAPHLPDRRTDRGVGDRRPPGGRQALRQGGASPGHRLVQGPRRDPATGPARRRGEGRGRDRDLGGQPRGSARHGGPARWDPCRRGHAGGRRALQGRGVSWLRGRGGPPRRDDGRGLGRNGAGPRRARPDVHPPVRPPGHDRWTGHCRPRDPRGPPGGRRRRGRCRRRRADLRHRDRDRDAATRGAGVGRRAGELDGDLQRPRRGRDRPGDRGERGRWPECPVCRRVDAAAREAPCRGRRDAHGPRDPERRAVRGRAHETGAGAGRSGRPRGGPPRTRSAARR